MGCEVGHVADVADEGVVSVPRRRPAGHAVRAVVAGTAPPSDVGVVPSSDGGAVPPTPQFLPPPIFSTPSRRPFRDDSSSEPPGFAASPRPLPAPAGKGTRTTSSSPSAPPLATQSCLAPRCRARNVPRTTSSLSALPCRGGSITFARARAACRAPSAIDPGRWTAGTPPLPVPRPPSSSASGGDGGDTPIRETSSRSLPMHRISPVACPAASSDSLTSLSRPLSSRTPSTLDADNFRSDRSSTS